MTTPKLLLPELIVGQAGKELTHNQALAILDQLTQPTVVDKDLAAPPGSPANGSMYIVAAAATGAWSGQSGNLAVWLTTVGAWTFITPANGWSVWVTAEAVRYERKAGAWAEVASGGGGDGVQCFILDCGDETSAITAGTNKKKFRMPYAFSISDMRTSLSTAQASGTIFTVDINAAGVSLLSTKLTIDNTEKTSVTAATPRVISSPYLYNDQEITIDVDTIGDGTATGLKAYLIGTRGDDAAAPYWRLNMTALNGSNYAGLGEIQMRAVSGGIDQCVGGTPSVISSTAGSAASLFDNNLSTQWNSNWAAGSWWVAYQFLAPVAIKELVISFVPAFTGVGAQSSPSAFNVEYSYDGATWFASWSKTGLGVWSAGETRTFTKP